MFVRKKKVKNNNYGYLVESKYTKKGSRQKVKKYLGKIFEVENNFEQFNNETYLELLKEFFESLILPSRVCIDYKYKKILFNNKECVLQVRDGFVYSDLMKKLFKLTRSEEDTPGQELAELLSNTGMKFSEEFFVKLYQSLE
jgi:hypothetical protein